MDHAEFHAIEDAFIDGFRKAADRQGFLRLANIPLELEEETGGPGLKLLRVMIEDDFAVGAAAPGFGTRELVYHPLPGDRIQAKTRLTFVYVSTDVRREYGLAEVIAYRDGTMPESEEGDGHHHHRHGHQHHGHG